jgi:hypothetical protein
MDYLLLARIGKLVALIGFLLPWVTVSCSGTEILNATGLQLMTGDLQPTGAFAQMEQNQESAEPAIGVIAALILVLAGLVGGFLTKGRTAAGVMLACAVFAMALSYLSIANMRTEMARQVNEGQSEEIQDNAYMSADQQRELARATASAIRIEEQEGYWLTVGALGASAILSLLVLAGAGGAPAQRDDLTPAS